MSICCICGEYATVHIHQMCSMCAASHTEVNRFGEKICEHGVTVGAYCHLCGRMMIGECALGSKPKTGAYDSTGRL